jgi:hypothetical protein
VNDEEMRQLIEDAKEDLKNVTWHIVDNPFTRWTFVDPETNLPTVLWPGKAEDCEEPPA